MKILFFTFLSILAFSSETHAADTDEFGYDDEVAKAFGSLQITAPTVHTNEQSLSENILSKDRGTLTATVRTTDSEASMRTTERKPNKKRTYDEMSSDSGM